jgi:hypothetical protein
MNKSFVNDIYQFAIYHDYGANLVPHYYYAKSSFSKTVESKSVGFCINMPLSKRFILSTDIYYTSDELNYKYDSIYRNDNIQDYTSDVVTIDRDMIYLPIMLKYIIINKKLFDLWLKGGVGMLFVTGIKLNEVVPAPDREEYSSRFKGTDIFISYGLGFNIKIEKSLSIPIEFMVSDSISKYYCYYKNSYQDYEETKIHKMIKLFIGLEWQLQ